MPFDTILDPATQRTRVRMVDVTSESYRIARRYMIRLDPNDFAETAKLTRLASVAGLTAEDFRKRFAPVVAHDRPA